MLEKLALKPGFRLATPRLSMRTLAVVCSALLGSTALAQQLTLELDSQTGSETLGRSDCTANTQHTLIWTASLPTTDDPCTNLYIWIAPNACEDLTDGGVPGETQIQNYTNQQGNANYWPTLGATAQTINFFTNQIVLGDGGSVCNDTTINNASYAVCAGYHWAALGQCTSTVNGAVQTVHPATQIYITFDSAGPPAPSITAVAGDTTVTVSCDDTADTSTTNPVISMDVSFRATPADGGTVDPWQGAGTISGNQGSLTVGGLADGQSYDFICSGTDQAGNTGANSTVASATPIQTNGFFGLYLSEGGHEKGGCAAAAGLAPWLAVAFLMRRRRGRAR
jgi:hypothetical protein